MPSPPEPIDADAELNQTVFEAKDVQPQRILFWVSGTCLFAWLVYLTYIAVQVSKTT